MSVIVDSVAPVTLRLVVRRQAGDATDFTTISAASISARKPRLLPNSDEAYVYVTWTPTLTYISESVIYLIYAFAAGAIDRIGTYSLSASLTVPAGTIPCDAVPLEVVARY